MSANKPEAMSLADLKRGDGEPSNPLGYAGEYHRRKARKARNQRGLYRDTRCELMMTFEQFKQQGVRNKIRRELGLEPVYLPGEGKPNS